MLFATNHHMHEMYSRLIWQLAKDQVDNMVEGSEEWNVRRYVIEKELEERKFFETEALNLQSKSVLYRDIEGLEDYRDFLRSAVTEKVEA